MLIAVIQKSGSHFISNMEMQFGNISAFIYNFIDMASIYDSLSTKFEYFLFAQTKFYPIYLGLCIHKMTSSELFNWTRHLLKRCHGIMVTNDVPKWECVDDTF